MRENKVVFRGRLGGPTISRTNDQLLSLRVQKAEASCSGLTSKP